MKEPLRWLWYNDPIRLANANSQGPSEELLRLMLRPLKTCDMTRHPQTTKTKNHKLQADRNRSWERRGAATCATWMSACSKRLNAATLSASAASGAAGLALYTLARAGVLMRGWQSSNMRWWVWWSQTAQHYYVTTHSRTMRGTLQAPEPHTERAGSQARRLLIWK